MIINYFLYKISDFIQKIELYRWRKISKFLKSFLILPKEKVLVKTLYGFNIFVNPKKRKGLEESIYYSGSYEKGFIDFLDKNLKQSDVFIDVGANIGFVTLFASKKVGKKGKVISFEPHPFIFNDLLENIKVNNYSNIVSINCALGAFDEISTLKERESINGGASTLLDLSGNDLSFKVEVRRFENIYIEGLNCEDIKFVKIDVEGFELAVLQGMESILTRDSPPIFIIEYSLDLISKNDSADLFNYISSKNKFYVLKFFRTKDMYGEIVKVESSSDLNDHDNIILVHKNIYPTLNL